MEKIKLVIWDLDETFWKGTLSEEGVLPIQENIDLVKELSKRGIINSIVSKNDFGQAKNKLKELGVWDYFVFPVIEWSAKGPLIKELIDACQLRDTNVLFLDDNHLNIEEARFYNDNLHAELPYFINKIKEHPAFKGKNDEKLSRLNHYKILEEKYERKKESSNIEDFLVESNIRISYIEDLESNIERVHELIDRTNQLNFTKKRLNLEEVEKFVEKSSNENRLLIVEDNFGNYGIVGFYSFNKNLNELEHFVFSCRILNLGVEQYIYSKLGFPKIDVVPEVAITLNNSTPFWIKEIDVQEEELKVKKKEPINNLKLLFKGGCDLSQMLFYLNDYEIDVVEETNYVKSGIPIHAEHSQILIDSINKDPKQIKYINKQIPFLDEDAYNTQIFSEKYDVLVYSVLMDYTQDLYKSNEGYLIPFGGYYGELTDQSKENFLVERFSGSGLKVMNRGFIKEFRKNHSGIGQISIDSFLKNLTKIRENLDCNTKVIFINGAEVALNNEEIGAYDRHKLMNEALDSFVEDNDNCYLLDVRKFVKSSDEVTDNIRHYSRNIYNLLSKELVMILDEFLEKNQVMERTFTKKIVSKFKFHFNKVVNKVLS